MEKNISFSSFTQLNSTALQPIGKKMLAKKVRSWYSRKDEGFTNTANMAIFPTFGYRIQGPQFAGRKIYLSKVSNFGRKDSLIFSIQSKKNKDTPSVCIENI